MKQCYKKLLTPLTFLLSSNTIILPYQYTFINTTNKPVKVFLWADQKKEPYEKIAKQNKTIIFETGGYCHDGISVGPLNMSYHWDLESVINKHGLAAGATAAGLGTTFAVTGALKAGQASVKSQKAIKQLNLLNKNFKISLHKYEKLLKNEPNIDDFFFGNIKKLPIDENAKTYLKEMQKQFTKKLQLVNTIAQKRASLINQLNKVEIMSANTSRLKEKYFLDYVNEGHFSEKSIKEMWDSNILKTQTNYIDPIFDHGVKHKQGKYIVIDPTKYSNLDNSKTYFIDLDSTRVTHFNRTKPSKYLDIDPEFLKKRYLKEMNYEQLLKELDTTNDLLTSAQNKQLNILHKAGETIDDQIKTVSKAKLNKTMLAKKLLKIGVALVVVGVTIYFIVQATKKNLYVANTYYNYLWEGPECWNRTFVWTGNKLQDKNINNLTELQLKNESRQGLTWGKYQFEILNTSQHTIDASFGFSGGSAQHKRLLPGHKFVVRSDKGLKNISINQNGQFIDKQVGNIQQNTTITWTNKGFGQFGVQSGITKRKQKRRKKF